MELMHKYAEMLPLRSDIRIIKKNSLQIVKKEQLEASSQCRVVNRLESKLLYFIIADGKKECLKKLCSILIRGILTTVLVAYGVLLTQMILKKKFG